MFEAFGALCSIIAVVMLAPLLNQGPQPPDLPDSHEALLLPRKDSYEIFSLGHNIGASQLLWFKLNSYFGKHFKGSRSYPWLESMCELVSALNPRAMHPFEFCASMLAWEAKDIDGAKKILNQAISIHPEEWRFWYLRGFLYWYFEKNEEQSLADFAKAASLPGTPAGIKILATRRAPTIEALLENLEALYHTTSDDRIRKTLAERIRRGRLARDLEVFHAAIKRFTEGEHRAPHDLGELVAKRYIPAVPQDPWGKGYQYKKETGEVSAQDSKLPLVLHEFSRRHEK